MTAEGFLVEDVPVVDGGMRADLRATLDDEEYLVEAKLREPSAGWTDLLARCPLGKAESLNRPVAPWSAISSTIERAYRQLLATPCSARAFRVLWVVALHADDDYVIDCFEKQLLGSALLVATTDGNDFSARICYHYSRAEFERCPRLDGAVLCCRAGGHLLVNSYSQELERFRCSRLYGLMSSHSAVIDPEVAALAGDALVVGQDFSGDRDGHAQWAYLKARYGLMTAKAVEFHHLGVLRIPGEDIPLLASLSGAPLPD